MRPLVRVLAACCALDVASPGLAATVDGLFNTGVNDSGAVLAGGETDSHYFVSETGTDAKVITKTPTAWLPNDSVLRWIWKTSTGLPIRTTRTFDLEFAVTGAIADLVLGGRWATDNFGLDVLLNGVSTGNTCSTYDARCGFRISDGFQWGKNVLSFRMRDVGIIAGMRVEFASIPLSGTLPLMLPALGTGVALVRRRAA